MLPSQSVFLDPNFDSIIQQRLALASNGQDDTPHQLNRKAAVLVPLLYSAGEWHLLYIRRSVDVQDHKGQVAFPGGAIEPEDEDVIAAAKRESREEVGLPADSIRILGLMSARNTISNYYITPVVGVVTWPFTIQMQVSEVSRVFTIPLRWLAASDHHRKREVIRPNGIQEPVFFFDEYDGELLWGITAAITLHFLEIIQQ